MIGGLLCAAFFIAVAWVARPQARPGEVHAAGVISRTWHGYMGGDPATFITVSFADASGREWEFEPQGISHGFWTKAGASAAVAYLPHDPQGTARKTDGWDGNYHWWIAGTGLVITVLTFAGFWD